MVKMDRYGGNETQRLYGCCPNYALILGNGLDFLWRRENPDFSEFNRYDRPFCNDPGQTESILIEKMLTIPRVIT